MTNIDQDRRVAHEWATSLDHNMSCWSDRERAAARVILATVEAPTPTLTERLREQFYYPEHTDEQHGIILDAVQMERDLAEARAEVERLTAVNENLHRTDNYREFREQFLTVQKGAESNAETPDPADVKPGEAWKANIWYDGVHQPGTAIKSAGSSDWVVIRYDGSRSTFRMNEYVELVSRLVSAPRVITNPDELDALPDDTIVRIDEGGDAMRKYKGKWHPTSNECCYESRHIALPVTVLWEPEA